MTIEVESTQVAEIFEKDINKLCEDINAVIEAHNKLVDENAELKNIIKEVKDYIKDKWEMELKDSMKDFLDHDDLIDRKRLLHILEILEKVD